MKTKSILSLAYTLVFVAVVGPASAGLIVANGDFQDLTGLTAQGGGWYEGVPAGWTGINATYTVYDTGSAVVANLSQLASNGSSPSLFLSQSVGTTDVTGNVTLTFDLPGTFGAAYSVGAGIYAGPFTNGTNYAFGTFSSVGSQTLTTSSPVAAGTALSVAFYLVTPGTPPALDNVAIAQVPEPGTWAMLTAGVACAAFLRRRSRRA
ncbi:MAG: PEP-CTERM sorting domain-containing protein [Planctomycetia bacterium]